MKYFFTPWLAVCLLLAPLDVQAQWQPLHIAPTTHPIDGVAVVRADTPDIWISAGPTAARWDGGVSRWSDVLRVPGMGARVLQLVPSDRAVTLYAATTAGLYQFDPSQPRWRLLVKGGWLWQRAIASVAEKPDGALWAAGPSGLFFSADERNWQKIRGPWGHAPIRELALGSGSALWLATDEEIYRESASGTFVLLWRVPRAASESESAEPAETDPMEATGESESDAPQTIEALRVDATGLEERAWAIHRRAVYRWDDGHSWQRLPQDGLQDADLRDLIAGPGGTLLVCSPKGIYLWDVHRLRWQAVSWGLAGNIRDLSKDPKDADRIWIATSGGIYMERWSTLLGDPAFNLAGGVPLSTGEVRIVSGLQPTIGEVTAATIAYNDLDPAKIRRWRRAAAWRAWLPRISVGGDVERDRLIDLDRGGTNDPDRYISGPYDEDFGFSVSASWELSDLIWSTDQTSIDVRSRLLTQLREDVLTEVVRLYFEWRRLSLDGSPAKQIQLEELSARLDAYTGGKFSELTRRGE